MFMAAIEWFNWMRKWRENPMWIMVMLAFAIIAHSTISFAGPVAISKDNGTHLVEDVRMSVDPVAAGRVDGVADRVSRIEANQVAYQSKQDGRFQQLESSLSRIDEVVDSRVDGRCENLHLMYAGCVVFAVRKGKCVI